MKLTTTRIWQRDWRPPPADAWFQMLISVGFGNESGLAQQIRKCAYLLWEEDGRPEGCTEEYWHRARDAHLRERAYVLGQQEGSLEGGAGEYWHKLREFEAQ